MPGDPLEFRTRWSVIEQLHSDDAAESWSWFIQRYRGYVAAVLRRMNLRAEAVDAATGDFWAYLFRTRAIERADRSGRFRSFLSGVVKNYALAWRREQAGRAPQAEQPGDFAQPDLREAEDLSLWASQILHLSLERLGREHPTDEQALRCFYGIPDRVGAEPTPRLRATAIAERIGCSANAMHQTLFRARSRLRDCIEQEVAATIGTSRDLHEELDLLTVAVGRAAPGIFECPADGQDA